MTGVAPMSANSRATTFVGRRKGSLSVVSHTTISGQPIERVDAVEMIAGVPGQAPAIGRPAATHSALILLRKRAEWWAFTQDERRAILEEDSHHIAIGMRYLLAVARRLLHCRDLDEEAPFDFIGYLDFGVGIAAASDEMLAQLRETKEWSYMDREIDIRMVKAS
jgi:hypothetical protein